MGEDARHFDRLMGLHTGVVVHGADTRILFSNHRAATLLGLSEAQMLGKAAVDPDWYFIDEAGQRIEPAQYPVSVVIATGQPLEALVYGVITPQRDGVVWLQVSAFPEFSPAGVLQEVVVNFNDITSRVHMQFELEESQAFVSAVLDSLTETVCVLDEQGTIVAVNQVWREFCAANGGDPAIAGEGANYLAACEWASQSDSPGAEDARAVAVQLRKLLAGQSHRFEHSYPCHAPGEQRWFMLRAARIAGIQPVRVAILHVNVTALRQTQEQLEESLALLHNLINSLQDGFSMLDRNGRITEANPAFCRMIGFAREELLGLAPPFPYWPPEEWATISAVLERCMRAETGEFELTLMNKSGLRFPAIISASPARDRSGTLTSFAATVKDISQRKQAEQALRIAAVSFEAELGIIVTDAANVILQVNKAFTEVTGYAAHEVIGQTPRLLRSGRHDEAFYAGIWTSIANQGSWQGEVWNRRKSGEVYPEWLAIKAVRDDHGQVTHYVGTFSDITQRKAAEEEIRNLAFSDPLTHLPNRRLLMERLQRAVAGAARYRRRLALLFVDLDHFKMLNDTVGHDKGDLLLQQVARLLAGCVREGDTVARLGGDEFVILLDELDEEEIEAIGQARVVCEKILARLSRSYRLGDLEHHSTASIGVTLLDGSQESSDELLKRADLAMYEAKAAGRNTFRFFDPRMQAVVSTRAALEAGLRAAIDGQQFDLYYQPLVADDATVTGAEALLRWRHPVRGVVLPGEFLALAEETGLIVPIGEWVLRTACEQLAQWARSPHLSRLTLAVNVSVRQFQQEDFVDTVVAALHLAGADPGRLRLELTETLLVTDAAAVAAKMNALKAIGVSFALDDFGTGYSSLASLKRLPLDQLKIDRSFVRDLPTDGNDAAIARMIIAVADSLALTAVAEGVETPAQRDALRALGCHQYQGYLYSQPLPVAQFDAYMHSCR